MWGGWAQERLGVGDGIGVGIGIEGFPEILAPALPAVSDVEGQSRRARRGNTKTGFVTMKPMKADMGGPGKCAPGPGHGTSLCEILSRLTRSYWIVPEWPDLSLDPAA